MSDLGTALQRSQDARRNPRGLVQFLAALALSLFLSPAPTVASCIDPFEDGTWLNDDLNTRGIRRVVVGFTCNDVIHCSVDANGNVHCEEPGPPWTVRLFGACSPSDCDWGAATGQDYYTADGARWIYAFYDQGFAKRYVFLKPSSLYPGHLFMWMFTDFTSPSRPDYVMRNWFHM